MKIKIRNYQSIRKVELEPEGFTIIVGDSNIGKSAIVRAIVGLLTNSLDASAIHKGQKEAAVVMEYGGHQYVVIRDKKTSVFHIDGKEYRKLNRKAHPLIGEHGLRVVQAGGVELTPQWNEDQFSPLLLLSKAVAPSQAASLITQATRLDVISNAQKSGAGELRSNKITLKTKKVDLESTESRLSRYRGLEVVVSATKGLQKKQEVVSLIQGDLETLCEIKARLEAVAFEMKALDCVKFISIPEIPSELNVQELLKLVELRDQYRRYQKEKEALSDISVTDVPSLGDLEKSIKDLSSLQDVAQQWLQNKKGVVELQREADALVETFKQFEVAEKKAREEIGVCPVCGKEL